MMIEHSQALGGRAVAVTPGGVNSPVRAFGAVGGQPVFIRSAEGAYLFDEDGNDYVDLIGAWGPAILGHAHPAVVSAVQEAAARGLSFGTPTAAEVELAELITARVTPVEQVRFVSSGTEATMSAIRLARGATGRDKVIKFAGCYHGHVDALLAEAGSGVATLGLPGSAGVTSSATQDTIVLPYNDLAAVRAVFEEQGEQIACVITEAAAANMGVVPPEPGFNAGLAELAHAHGALYVSDEVMTGFRVSEQGWFGIDGVAADIVTFGKVMGGGLPAAGFAGTSELMAQLAPSGPVYQAGTLSGNPVAMAAGAAALRHCDQALYSHLNATATEVAELATKTLTQAGVPHRLQFAGNLFSIFFGVTQPVREYEQARRLDSAAYAAFFHEMLRGGVHLPPSGYEAWFVSGAHGDAALTRIAAALPTAAEAAMRSMDNGSSV